MPQNPFRTYNRDCLKADKIFLPFPNDEIRILGKKATIYN